MKRGNEKALRMGKKTSRLLINLRANQDSKLQMAALKKYCMRRIKVRDIVSVTDTTSEEKIKAIEK